MSQEPNSLEEKFQREFTMFKDHRKPDYELKRIFEMYLPFWYCRQNVVVEKDLEIDRFSKVILQTIQAGFKKHSEICLFLGIDVNSFVTSQFHFLVKNGFLNEKLTDENIEYETTFEGLSLLERKRKVTSVETVEFEYFYNDLTLEFLDKLRFDFLVSDLTKDLFDSGKFLDGDKVSEGKKKKFSGYRVLQTNLLPPNRREIPHKNKPYNLNRVEFANFFNRIQKNCSFYDFESSGIETHKRSICFLAFEYEDKSGVKVYEIRHFKKSVRQFERHELEENLSKKTNEYLKRNRI